jgi:hypothetical protein
MAISPVPKIPNVNLTKYVNIGENRWRFCPVVIAGNGRIKPDYVWPEAARSFIAKALNYVEWYEDGSRHRRSVGKNAIEAHAQQQRHIQLLRR